MTIAISVIDPTAIGTYSDLLTMIPLWMDRDDLADEVPKFISLVEPSLNRRLRTLNMEVRDLWTVASVPYDLPADFRMIRALHIDGSPDRPLTAKAPTATPFEYSGEAGIPQAYYTTNRQLMLEPPPAPTVQLRAVYYSRIAPLNAANQSNWLLIEHPDVYVWGILKQAAIFIRDPEAAAACENMEETAIAEVMAASRRDKWGGAPLVPSGCRQVRGSRC